MDNHMDNEKMGRFICEMRKTRNMTQKDLAEQCGVTDKAVSKWERGLSLPDVSLIMPLARSLGVTAGELLTGERKAACEKPLENEDERIVEETLRYSGRSAARKLEKVRRGVFAVTAGSFLIAVMVCLICDFCITGGFSWSLIVLASLLYSWLLLLPFFKAEGHIARNALCSLSLTTIPYLGCLSVLLGAPVVLKTGACVSVIALVGLWGIYAVFRKFSGRRWRAAGIFFFIVIGLNWSINYSVAFLNKEALTPSSIASNKIVTVIAGILSVLCFGIDHCWARVFDA